MEMVTTEGFKACPACDTGWEDRSQFLNDPKVRLVGYQADFDELRRGLMLFNCRCGSTISLHVNAFADLYDGHVYNERQTGGDECPRYCLHEHILSMCTAKCECAWVRGLMVRLKEYEAA